MKNYLFAFFTIFFLFLNVVSSQELEKITEIDLFEMHKSGKYEYESTEIYTSKIVNLGNYSAYHLGIIIDDVLKKHRIHDKRNVIMFIVDSEGNKTTADIFSFDEENAVIPATAVFEKVKAKKFDTIVVADKEDEFLTPDFKGIDEAIKAGATKRIYTPVPDVSREEVNRLFQGFCIVFPEDKTTARWIPDAVKFELYYIRHRNE